MLMDYLLSEAYPKASDPLYDYRTRAILMSVAVWKEFIPWYFYSAVLLCLAFIAAVQGLSGWSVVLSLAAGFLSWGLIEYVLHRFIFHYDSRSRIGRKLLYHAHISHHED